MSRRNRDISGTGTRPQCHAPGSLPSKGGHRRRRSREQYAAGSGNRHNETLRKAAVGAGTNERHSIRGYPGDALDEDSRREADTVRREVRAEQLSPAGGGPDHGVRKCLIVDARTRNKGASVVEAGGREPVSCERGQQGWHFVPPHRRGSAARVADHDRAVEVDRRGGCRWERRARRRLEQTYSTARRPRESAERVACRSEHHRSIPADSHPVRIVHRDGLEPAGLGPVPRTNGIEPRSTAAVPRDRVPIPCQRKAPAGEVPTTHVPSALTASALEKAGMSPSSPKSYWPPAAVHRNAFSLLVCPTTAVPSAEIARAMVPWPNCVNWAEATPQATTENAHAATRAGDIFILPRYTRNGEMPSFRRNEGRNDARTGHD